MHDLLTNPVYAGAFVFGRTRTEKRIDPAGRVISRTVALPREQWEVLIPGHHRRVHQLGHLRGNTAALRANWRRPARDRAAARPGKDRRCCRAGSAAASAAG